MAQPFFSIRIEWNPADSEDESHRDRFVVRRTVARQFEPFPEWFEDEKKRSKPLRDDTCCVVRAITRCIHDVSREASWRMPDLVEDVISDLAMQVGFDNTALSFAAVAIDGAEDEFLDELQKLIDRERKKAKRVPEAKQ